MIEFSKDNSSGVPIHQQLKQAILLEILSERLKSGDILPSIRSLAKILKINPNTVAKVYYTLEEDGFIEGKRGSGYTVRNRKQKSDKFRMLLIESELKEFLEKALSLGFNKKELLEMIEKELKDER